MASSSFSCAPSAHALVSVDEARAACLEWAPAPRILSSKLESHFHAAFDYGSLLHAVLAQDVTSKENIPVGPTSTRDGFAIRAADLDATFRVVSAGRAGAPASAVAGEGRASSNPPASYVTTGALLPDFADCVVPIENVQWIEETAGLSRAIGDLFMIARKAKGSACVGKNVRHAGSDVRKGDIILHKGKVIESADLALLASIGARPQVYRRPLVQIVSTGDELIDSSAADPRALAAGHVRDANRLLLLSALRSLRAGRPDTLDGGMRSDSAQDIAEAITAASACADVLVITGGTSVGDCDTVKRSLAGAGDIKFGRVKMKPGKPTSFAVVPRKDNKIPLLVFSLPGNPVSAFVGLHIFVIPTLYQMCGMDPRTALKRIPCILSHDFVIDPERPEFHRARISHSSAGMVASSTGSQVSSRIASLTDADVLLEFPSGAQLGGARTLKAGTCVNGILISSVTTCGNPNISTHSSIDAQVVTVSNEVKPRVALIVLHSEEAQRRHDIARVQAKLDADIRVIAVEGAEASIRKNLPIGERLLLAFLLPESLVQVIKQMAHDAGARSMPGVAEMARGLSSSVCSICDAWLRPPSLMYLALPQGTSTQALSEILENVTTLL